VENIAPPLRLVLALRRSIENGDSMVTALRKYLELPGDELTPVVMKCLVQSKLTINESERLSPCRQALVSVIQSGLEGQPVLPAIIRLEQEIIDQCHLEMEKTLGLIPFQLMWPMLLLQFPAYLVLLLGPLVDVMAGGLL
jgi:hypothetical protein